MAKLPKDEPKAGVPAFMATFADLMTLLLVFFILLNVYANERQYGLLSAMTGSISAAFFDKEGEGGLLDGSASPIERDHARADFKHWEDGEGPEAKQRRTGEEVGMGRSSAERYTGEEELEISSAFSFAHGSAELTRESRKYLDGFARKYSSPEMTVKIVSRSAFTENFQPMELSFRRLKAMLGYLEAVGMTARLIPVGVVASRPGPVRRTGNAIYRSVSIKVVRRR